MASEIDFSGRAVAVWAKEPANGGMLVNGRVVQVAGRGFIAGELADNGTYQDSRIGATLWFPLDDVLVLTVFPDLAVARAAYEARRQSKDAQGAAEDDGGRKPGKRRFWG